MSYTAEQLQAAHKARDGSLAYQRVLETQSLVQELRLLQAALLQQHPPEEVRGICAIGSLTLLFGSEFVSMTAGEQFRDHEARYKFIFRFIEEHHDQEGWMIKIPSSSSEFIELMDTQAVAALIELQGHEIGIIPTWKSNPQNAKEPLRRYIVLEADLPEVAKQVEEDELASLYADALILEHTDMQDNSLLGKRAVLVFTQEIPAIE